MDVIDAKWTDIESANSSALAVRSQDLSEPQRLDLVPVIFKALPVEYQTKENYADLEFRARNSPQKLDSAIALTGKTVPELVQHNHYQLTHTADNRSTNNLYCNPRIELTVVNTGAQGEQDGWWFWTVILGFLLLIAVLLGGE